ncbi:MAG: hypothetical protein U1C56_00645 [Candidatus Curtissbacteria bacterium]|nr:hypothetical protein [Candidatus Curtissbacteria bacterium]
MNFRKALFAAVILVLALSGVYFFSDGGQDFKANVLSVDETDFFKVYGDLLMSGGDVDLSLNESYERPWLVDKVDFDKVLGFWEGNYNGFGGIDGFEGKEAAFVLDDVGMKYPAAIFYLDVSSDLVAGKDLMNFLGGFVKGFLVDFGFSEDSLVENVVVVRGFGMKKLTIDWEKAGEAVLVLGASGFADVVGEDMSLYYGVSDDGVLILALYPDFEEVYGEGSGFDDSGVFLMARGNDLYNAISELDAWNFLSDYIKEVVANLKDRVEVSLNGEFDETLGVLKISSN